MTTHRPVPDAAGSTTGFDPDGRRATASDRAGSVRQYPSPTSRARDARASRGRADSPTADGPVGVGPVGVGPDGVDVEEPDDLPHMPPAGGGRSPTPLIGRVIAVQLICVAVLVGLGHRTQVVLATAAVLPALGAWSLITVRSHTFGRWVAIWLSWRRRRRQAATISDEGDPVNPLWLLDRKLSIGAIRGFRRGELGVMNLGRNWVSAVWVTDGARAARHDAPDGLTTLLALPPSPVAGTKLYAVLQQATADLGAGPAMQLTAWLSVRVEPLTALPAKHALTAVPAMIRAEIRRLFRESADGPLKLVPLDRNDLLSALAASTEVPLEPSTTTVENVTESWHLWQARGRFHHAFQLHPGSRRPLPVLVALAMDMAGYSPETCLTICIPYPPVPRHGRHPLPVLRLSHPDPIELVNLADEIMEALDEEGAATYPLSGRQGPALLDTSILAGPGHW